MKHQISDTFKISKIQWYGLPLKGKVVHCEVDALLAESVCQMLLLNIGNE